MNRKKTREAVPLQVYLVADERERLERLADQLDATKSDVIRRGLLALERELAPPAAHPALKLIGIADDESPAASPIDAARDHDQVIADAEEASWTRPCAERAPARGERAKKRRRAR